MFMGKMVLWYSSKIIGKWVIECVSQNRNCYMKVLDHFI